MEDTSKSNFDVVLFDALLNLLSDIEQIQSAGGLQCIMLLLYKVMNQEHLQELTTKCLSLLFRISDELMKRTNQYHLILRSRFGLYGTPFEPELFDIEPPPPGKSSSTSVTYASVVNGDNNANNMINNNDFYTVYSFNKDNLDPKDVLTTMPDTKIKLRNVTPSRLLRGLLETEPLHFTCLSASDGTRLERADINHGNLFNFVPLTVNSSHQTTLGTKKVDSDINIEKFAPSGVTKIDKFSTNNGQSVSNNINDNPVENVYELLLHPEQWKKEDFAKLSKSFALYELNR